MLKFISTIYFNFLEWYTKKGGDDYMNNQKGVTVVTMIIMIVVMTIIASVSIIGGVSVIKEAQGQVDESNLADVKNAVNAESAKINTAGVLTPANATYYGVKNAELGGIRYNEDGTKEEIKQKIGEDWYFLDEKALKEMGIEYANEEYVVNYKLNVVIPLSTTQNVHEQIEIYNAQG